MYRAKLTRRQFLGGVAAASAGLAALRCGGGGEEEAATPQVTTGEPKRGGIIRMATTAPALSLDPHTDNTLAAVTKPYTYGYLVHVTEWKGLDGDLAKKWEVVDALDWIFHMRPGVRFHNEPPVNGRPLVAGDVAYSYKRIEVTPGASLTGWNEWIDRYEAPDDQTFTVHTKKPYAYIFMTLGSPRMAVVPREAVEEFGDLKSHMIGTGPFMLKSWDVNQGIEVERNPDYYRSDIPYLDGLNWIVMPDDAAIQASFRAGRSDVYAASDRLRAESVSSVKGASTQKYLNRLYTVLILNAARVPAFTDERVREAVDISLDREAMIQKIHLGDAELCGPVGPSWDTALPPEEIEQAYKRDVAKAKQLLTAAGQEDLSFTLVCASYADNPDRAAIIQQNLQEAGIRVQLETRDLGTWLNDLYAVNYEANTYANLPYLSDDIQLQSHHSKGFNRAMFFGITDPEVDSLLEQVQTTIDDEARKELARQVQRKILKRHGPTLTLYEPYAYFVAYDYIKNYKPGPWGFGMYKFDMWIDKGQA
jgi:ABC-type transport system substrate-binding protein